MNRSLRILAPCILTSLAACSDDRVAIMRFEATPDSIEAGQTAMLRFTVDPPDAVVTIAEVGDMTDQVEVPVNPKTTTTYHLMATSGEARDERSVTVTVAIQPVVAISVEPASETSIAGDSLSVKLIAVGANGLPTPSFRGTVRLTSSDPAAVLPPGVTFLPADFGVKEVKVAFKTAGLATLTAVDVLAMGRRGVAAVSVKPAAAASCTAGPPPGSGIAGGVVGISVAVHDPFGNVAAGYAGTIRLTASDPRAVLPPDVTYVPAMDAGNHAFSAQLLTTGPQLLTASDLANASIRCEASLIIRPAAPKIVLTIPRDANAGYPVNLGVTVRDLFDNAIPNYAGTVTFTSTDTGTGAVTPPPIVFTGSEGGVATTSATFVTLGSQLISARDQGAPVATGSTASTCHGLVYTGPTTGRVRLVVNASQSNTQVVQLDMLANERLELSTFFGGGPGSFASGMNLPLDTTRATAGTPLVSSGNALIVPPTTLPVAVGTLNTTDHTLYTAVSRRRVSGTPVFNQVTEVQAGQVFYSVRLRLTQNGTVGPVFDGQQPSPRYRASVRDQYGDDFVSQTDFGIGKLEIR